MGGDSHPNMKPACVNATINVIMLQISQMFTMKNFCFECADLILPVNIRFYHLQCNIVICEGLKRETKFN